MGEKRKHVAFSEDTQTGPSEASAGPSIHPARAAQAPVLAAEGKKPEKSDRKKKYLAKKNKKHRKLAAARKASAPKNREPISEQDGSDNDDRDAAPAADLSGAAPLVSSSNSEAGPSRPTNGAAAIRMNGTNDAEEEERARRKAEKQAKREARRSDPERAAKKAKKREREAGMEDAVDQDRSTTIGAGPQPTDRAEGEVESGEDEGEGEVEEAEPPPAVDGAGDHSIRSGPAASPPPLQPFPLPTPAAAPDRALLSRQGLPANLSDATLIPQTLRLPLSDLSALSPIMRERLAELGVHELFAVQAALLPVLLELDLVPLPLDPLHDYLVSAPTGSGKTLAYAVPIVHILTERCVPRLRALIVLPTRELVDQVREVMDSLIQGTDLKVGSISGKQSFAREQEMLIEDREHHLLGGSSNVDILIATPGRLIDHLKSTQNFSLQHLRFLVIDEADRLINQSFQDWLAQVLKHVTPPTDKIQLPEDFKLQPCDQVDPAWMEPFGLIDRSWEGCLPARHACQKLLFSATLTRDPSSIAALHLRDPQYFIVRTSESTDPTTAQPDNFAVDFGESFALPTSLTERSLILPPALKPLNMIHLLHHPEWQVRRALVFTKSVESADRLVHLLNMFEEEYRKKAKDRVVVSKYTGDLAPNKRKALLDSFEKDQTHILVCSDLVSRGLDLPTVSHVISYDVPLDMRKYVHRVGRTARAGREGTAWTIVEKQEALHWKAMLKQAGHERKVRKIKVKEEELAEYRAAYERAMARLRALYSHD